MVALCLGGCVIGLLILFFIKNENKRLDVDLLVHQQENKINDDVDAKQNNDEIIINAIEKNNLNNPLL